MDPKDKENSSDYRGAILPFKIEDGEKSWALPQWMIDIKKAIELPREVLMEGHQPTVEDVTNFALTVGAGGFGAAKATGVTKQDALLGTFSGGKPKHQTPMYSKNNDWLPKDYTVKGDDVYFGDHYFGNIDEFKKEFEEGLGGSVNATKTTEFRSPLIDSIEHMDFPAKGSAILKDLNQNALDLRKSELKAYDLSSIDPNKTYTKEEILPLITNQKYHPRASTHAPGGQYRQYQRQNVVDKEVAYAEVPVDASRTYSMDGPKGFKANSQHYNDDTLSHVRMSVREPDGEPIGDWPFQQIPFGGGQKYVLIEELQSDLVQKGWKSKKDVPDFNKVVDDVLASSRDGREADWRAEGSPVEQRSQLDLFEAYYQVQLFRNLRANLGDEFKNDVTTRLEDAKKKLESFGKYFDDEIPSWLREDALDDARFIGDQAEAGGSEPPINSITEATRLGIQTAIAYAQQQGVDKVVIPPLDRIVDVRDFENDATKQKMLQPGSAFHNTYVNAVKKVLNGMKNELGDKIKVEDFELKYDDAPVSRPDPVTLFGDAANMYMQADDFDQFAEMFIQQYPEYVDQYDYIRATYDAIEDEITAFTPESTPSSTKAVSNKGTAIDISGLKDYDLTRPRFAKGGTVMSPEKEIPPGAVAKNVSDDIPIMASEGEYIIPANVVNYIGLEKIQKMVDGAKEALGDTSVQTPGGEISEDDDELPFDPSELQGFPHMAEGGEVIDPNSNPVFSDPTNAGGAGVKAYTNEDGQVVYIPTMGGEPMYTPPAGFKESTTPTGTSAKEAPMPTQRINPLMGGAPMQQDNSANENDAFVDKNKSPLAGNPNDWTVKDFINFGEQRQDPGGKMIKGIISMLPAGKLAMAARDKYLNNETADLMDKMLDEGLDLQGNPISPEDKAMLSKTRSDLISQMSDQSGLNLNPIERIGDAVRNFTNFVQGKPQQTREFDRPAESAGPPRSAVSQEAQQMYNPPITNTSDNQYSGGGYGMGSDIGRDPDKGPSSGQMASGGLYNKGGLIKRRMKNR